MRNQSKINVSELQSRGNTIVFPESACVLLIDSHQNIVFVVQHRAVVQKTTIELPGGKCEPGEDSQACARREVLEETGIRCGRLKELFVLDLDTSAALHRTHVFLCSELSEPLLSSSPPVGDMVLQKTSLPDAYAMVMSGAVTHAPTVAAILWKMIDEGQR
jgi:ADP-ribose pyrophosphatase